MSLLDKIKSFFSGGSDDAGVRPADEPDAATAMDTAPEAPPPMPPADPAGMPTSEPQPAEPTGGTDPLAEGGEDDRIA
jgi:hypothetical protein